MCVKHLMLTGKASIHPVSYYLQVSKGEGGIWKCAFVYMTCIILIIIIKVLLFLWFTFTGDLHQSNSEVTKLHACSQKKFAC